MRAQPVTDSCSAAPGRPPGRPGVAASPRHPSAAMHCRRSAGGRPRAARDKVARFDAGVQALERRQATRWANERQRQGAVQARLIDAQLGPSHPTPTTAERGRRGSAGDRKLAGKPPRRSATGKKDLDLAAGRCQLPRPASRAATAAMRLYPAPPAEYRWSEEHCVEACLETVKTLRSYHECSPLGHSVATATYRTRLRRRPRRRPGRAELLGLTGSAQTTASSRTAPALVFCGPGGKRCACRPLRRVFVCSLSCSLFVSPVHLRRREYRGYATGFSRRRAGHGAVCTAVTGNLLMNPGFEASLMGSTTNPVQEAARSRVGRAAAAFNQTTTYDVVIAALLRRAIGLDQ